LGDYCNNRQTEQTCKMCALYFVRLPERLLDLV